MSILAHFVSIINKFKKRKALLANVYFIILKNMENKDEKTKEMARKDT